MGKKVFLVGFVLASPLKIIALIIFSSEEIVLAGFFPSYISKTINKT